MYCLDTNIVIYYQNNIKKIVDKLLSCDPDSLCITHISRAELFYGAYKSLKIEQNLNTQQEFCAEIKILNSSEKSDKIFGELKARMNKSGKVVADLDLLIASICLANDLILVTNNTKHFQNIEGLKLENWM